MSQKVLHSHPVRSKEPANHVTQSGISNKKQVYQHANAQIRPKQSYQTSQTVIYKKNDRVTVRQAIENPTNVRDTPAANSASPVTTLVG